MKNTYKLNICIENLTESQALAIEDMLHMWQHLGGAGASRWVSFFADGDGNFRPKITVNGAEPQGCNLGQPALRWKNNEYRIDFDEIAWAIHARDEAAKPKTFQAPSQEWYDKMDKMEKECGPCDCTAGGMFAKENKDA